MLCSAELRGSVCATAMGFSQEEKRVKQERVSWDFPLSRAEKVTRVLSLYQAELDTTSEMLTDCEQSAWELRHENDKLNQQLEQQSRKQIPLANKMFTRMSTASCAAASSVSTDVGVDSKDVFGSSDDAPCVDVSRRSSCGLQDALKQPSNSNFLRASLRGTASMLEADSGYHGLQPVQELQHSSKPVTCICFGRQTQVKPYALLAVASLDGSLVLYRCYRTEVEMAMLAEKRLSELGHAARATPSCEDYIQLHHDLVGHMRPITACSFNPGEDQLISASHDKTIRFWSVATGEMLRVLVSGSAVTATALLPNSHLLVAATSGAVLRLVDIRKGNELQTLRCESSARALAFEGSGRCLFAGTSTGNITVFENRMTCLHHLLEVEVADSDITSIDFVAGTSCGRRPYVLANSSDASVWIMECAYSAKGVVSDLFALRQLQVGHSRPGFSRRCCFSSSGQGYVVSGSSDGDVQICPILGADDEDVQHLVHHTSPVLATAVNLQDTLLATADASGRVVLWRRLTFSHLSE